MQHFKYMAVNMSNMNKHDYNDTQIQMLDTKNKTIQHIKVEDLELNNIIDFEINTLRQPKH